MSTTRISCRIEAPRARVYQAFVDAEALQRWRVPPAMTSQIHTFEPRVGGRFRVTLTYKGSGAGKSDAHSDTYHGHFVELVPNERIVEAIEFETTDPKMQGEMTITVELHEAGGATELVATHEHVPPGVNPADNELGWRQSLEQLRDLVGS